MRQTWINFYRQNNLKYSMTRRPITSFILCKIIAGIKNLLPVKQTTEGKSQTMQNRDDIQTKATDLSLMKVPQKIYKFGNACKRYFMKYLSSEFLCTNT